MDFDYLRRPLGILALAMIAVYVVTGAFEIVVLGEASELTFALSLVTFAVVLAMIVEKHYGIQSG